MSVDTSTKAVERLAELQEDDLVRPDGYIAADTIRALAAERDELRQALSQARSDALEEAAKVVDAAYARGDKGNPGHHIHLLKQETTP